MPAKPAIKLRKDLSGQTFGRLDVIEFADRVASKARWHCRCRCGVDVIAYGYNLSSGHTMSCGCLRLEAPAANILHGLSKTRAHNLWRKMLDRCKSPSSRWFERYGGRGIKVCERWHSFANFYADMGEPPPRMSIERMDNDGHYEPGNCCWATDKEQARNKSTTRRITKGGMTLSMAEWCERLGLNRHAIQVRIRHGWPEERWLDPLMPPTIANRDALGRIAKGDAAAGLRRVR